MTMELYYLIVFALLIIATIFTQQISSIFSEGLLPLLGSREGLKFNGLTGRLERSITNSAISMVIILPPVLAIQITESSTPEGILAMQIFLGARLLYVLSYAFSVSGLRSAAWVTGMLCTLWLFASLL